MNMTEAERNSPVKSTDFEKWWTPEWMDAIKEGLFVRRDLRVDKCPRYDPVCGR